MRKSARIIHSTIILLLFLTSTASADDPADAVHVSKASIINQFAAESGVQAPHGTGAPTSYDTTSTSKLLLTFPDPVSGSPRQFEAEEIPMMLDSAFGKASGFQNVRAYTLSTVDGSPTSGTLLIGDESDLYLSMFGTDNRRYLLNSDEYLRPVSKIDDVPCYMEYPKSSKTKSGPSSTASPLAEGGTLSSSAVSKSPRQFRVALTIAGKVTELLGGSKPAALWAAGEFVETARVFVPYGINLKLIYTKALLPDQSPFVEFTAPPKESDDVLKILNKNTELNQQLLDSAESGDWYDIGHLLARVPGGLTPGFVCNSATKGRGISGIGVNPTFPPSIFRVLWHEIGHQFFMVHTFSRCGLGINWSDMLEPGAGVTIMSYAGNCGPPFESVGERQDFFHSSSFSWLSRIPESGCGVLVTQARPSPSFETHVKPSIPLNTQFRIPVRVKDAVGFQRFRFHLEHQYRIGITDGRMQSLFLPVYFMHTVERVPQVIDTFAPVQAEVLFERNVSADPFEILPGFDNKQAIGEIDLGVTVVPLDPNFKPSQRAHAGSLLLPINFNGERFQLTAPLPDATLTGGSLVTVTWKPGGGAVASKVDLILSNYLSPRGVDSGHLEPETNKVFLIATRIPNSGRASVEMPNVSGRFGLYIRPSRSQSGEDDYVFHAANGPYTLKCPGNEKSPVSDDAQSCTNETPTPAASPSPTATVGWEDPTPTLPIPTPTSTPATTATPSFDRCTYTKGAGWRTIDTWICASGGHGISCASAGPPQFPEYTSPVYSGNCYQRSQDCLARGAQPGVIVDLIHYEPYWNAGECTASCSPARVECCCPEIYCCELDY